MTEGLHKCGPCTKYTFCKQRPHCEVCYKDIHLVTYGDHPPETYWAHNPAYLTNITTPLH